MVKFDFAPLSDPRLTEKLKAQFLAVGQLITREITDSSGTYSGLVIIGERRHPLGYLQSIADITFDFPAEGRIPAGKVQELSEIVQTEFAERTIIGIKKPPQAA